jgi:ABC-type branched-subunit amino acid transport system permease subunit
MGHIFGQALGATFLTLLADMLLTKFPYYYMLLYGVILIIVILFLPGGLVGLKDEIKSGLRGMRQRYENT